MTDGESIGPDETLWRGVFSSGRAERARRGKIAHDIFLERKGVLDISVNRLDDLSESERTRMGGDLAPETEDLVVQKRCAQELARAARWVPRA